MELWVEAKYIAGVAGIRNSNQSVTSTSLAPTANPAPFRSCCYHCPSAYRRRRRQLRWHGVYAHGRRRAPLLPGPMFSGLQPEFLDEMVVADDK